MRRGAHPARAVLLCLGLLAAWYGGPVDAGYGSPADADAAAAVVAYWTPARMRAATPVVPTGRTGGIADLRDGGSAASVVGPVRAPTSGGRPRRDGAGAGHAGGAAPTPTTGRSDAGARRAAGRAFFRLGGRDRVCSASTVRSRNRDTVVTAAHCLAGRRRTATRWLFVPAYRDGGGPYGAWTARRLFVPPGRGTPPEDVGFAVLAPARGLHVADVVGAPPIAFGTAPGRWTTVYGYPATGLYTGEELLACRGPARRDPAATGGLGLACAMREGSSGGPWLVDLAGVPTVTSVTSVGDLGPTGRTRTVWGPPFGPAVRDLYARAAAS